MIDYELYPDEWIAECQEKAMDSGSTVGLLAECTLLLCDRLMEARWDSQALRNLLARVHRDGGHHIGEDGIQKAVEDADAKIIEMLALADDLKFERDRCQLLVRGGMKILADLEEMQRFRDNTKANNDKLREALKSALSIAAEWIGDGGEPSPYHRNQTLSRQEIARRQVEEMMKLVKP